MCKYPPPHRVDGSCYTALSHDLLFIPYTHTPSLRFVSPRWGYLHHYAGLHPPAIVAGTWGTVGAISACGLLWWFTWAQPRRVVAAADAKAAADKGR